jgi:hypothetical protein
VVASSLSHNNRYRRGLISVVLRLLARESRDVLSRNNRRNSYGRVLQPWGSRVWNWYKLHLARGAGGVVDCWGTRAKVLSEATSILDSPSPRPSPCND